MGNLNEANEQSNSNKSNSSFTDAFIKIQYCLNFLKTMLIITN